MRKRFNKLFSQAILIFMVLFSCFPGQAGAAFLTGGNVPNQFSNNGTSIVYTSGNMGIGTTVPGYALDVQGGQMNASGGLCIAGSCKTAWTQITGSNFWGGAMDGNIWNGTAGAGNVGINTTNPTTKLDVNGSLRVNSATISLLNQAGVVMADDSGNLYATSSAVATGIPTGTNGQTLRSNGTNWLANSTLFNDGTNIGIGTTTPTSKLDVFGTFEATASSSSIILDANGNILIGI